MTAIRHSLPEPPNTARRRNPRSQSDFNVSVVAVPLGAIATISLIQKVFRLALRPVLANFIAVWDHLTAPLSYFLSAITPFQLPGWYPDLFIISFILVTLFCTSLPAPKSLGDRVTNWVFSLFASLLATGFLLLIARAWEACRQSADNRESANRHLGYVFQAICLTVVFYAANTEF